MTEKRTGFLDRILGKDKSEQLSSELSAIANQLDKDGHARKEFDTLKQKGVIEDLHTDFMSALAKVTDSPDEAIASEMIALAMGRLLQAPAEEETMMEDEDMGSEEVDEEFRSLSVQKQLSLIHEGLQQNKEYMESAKAYTDESTQVVKDMGEIAQALLPMFEVVKQLTPVIKNLESLKADDLHKRMGALEEQFKSRPRASQAFSTVVSDSDVTLDKIKNNNLDDVPEMFKGAFKQE